MCLQQTMLTTDQTVEKSYGYWSIHSSSYFLFSFPDCEHAINEYIDSMINIPTRALCWTFTVIFLLETSKIILHCNQSGDDNIAAYVFDNAERQVKQKVEPMFNFFFHQRCYYSYKYICLKLEITLQIAKEN